MDYLARESLIERSLVVGNVRVWLPLKEKCGFQFRKGKANDTPLLVLPNVTCLQKGNKRHMQIAKRDCSFSRRHSNGYTSCSLHTKGRIHGIYNKNCLQLSMH